MPRLFRRRVEFLFYACVILGIFYSAVLRGGLGLHRGVESDEFEALHAAWCVAQGDVPYRDFWQNHTPFLYYLLAPLFLVLPEGPVVIFVARGLMFLFASASVFLTYKIGGLLFGRKAGLLAALLLGFMDMFTLRMLEVRPDLLLVFFWLLGLYVWLRTFPRKGGAVFAGILVGAGFVASPKGLFPLAAIGFSTLALLAGSRTRAAGRAAAEAGLLFAAGFTVPFLLILALFSASGAGGDLWRWTVTFNFTIPGPKSFHPVFPLSEPFYRGFWVVSLAGLGTAVSAAALRVKGLSAALLGAAAAGPALAGVALRGGLLWPGRESYYWVGCFLLFAAWWVCLLRSRRADPGPATAWISAATLALVYVFYMPRPWTQSAATGLPLFAVFGGLLLRELAREAFEDPPEGPGFQSKIENRKSKILLRAAAAALLAFAVTAAVIGPGKRTINGHRVKSRGRILAGQLDALKTVLRLTRPEDVVLDAFGQSIFRPHAYFYYKASELTSFLHGEGKLPLPGQEGFGASLEKNRCRLVVNDAFLADRMPPSFRDFVAAHYVPLPGGEAHGLHVPGFRFAAPDRAPRRFSFRVLVPGRYVISRGNEAARATLDGEVPTGGGADLSAGPHEVTIDEGPDEVLLFFPSRSPDPDHS